MSFPSASGGKSGSNPIPSNTDISLHQLHHIGTANSHSNSHSNTHANTKSNSHSASSSKKRKNPPASVDSAPRSKKRKKKKAGSQSKTLDVGNFA